MSFRCNLCNNTFVQKTNLQRHLNEKRCKSVYIDNYFKINELLDVKNTEIDNNIIKLDNINREFEYIINDKEKIIEDRDKILKVRQKELEEKENTIIAQRKQIEELLNKVNERDLIINAHEHSQVNNKCNNVNNINMKIEIIVNSINKLDVNYLDHNRMKQMIESYDNDKELKGGKDFFSSDKVNLLLGDYIKDIICNKEHPENHAVKYIKKKPPTYNTQVEDSDGNTVSVIKGLKDTCELLTDPILDKLKVKLKEFIKKYKGDTEPEFDFALYENAIKELKKELNKKNVKKALNSVLKNDILNNIEMKLSLIEPPKKGLKEN